MKTKQIFILIILLTGITNCKKSENAEAASGINFCTDEQVSNVIVGYNDIIGYDSAKYVYRVTESAWSSFKNQIPLEEIFEISVTLDNQVIYNTRHIPGFNSWADFENITFYLINPDLIYLILGYPGGWDPELFTGEDLRNDMRLIDQLKTDHKLIEIDIDLE